MGCFRQQNTGFVVMKQAEIIPNITDGPFLVRL